MTLSIEQRGTGSYANRSALACVSFTLVSLSCFQSQPRSIASLRPARLGAASSAKHLTTWRGLLLWSSEEGAGILSAISLATRQARETLLAGLVGAVAGIAEFRVLNAPWIVRPRRLHADEPCKDYGAQHKLCLAHDPISHAGQMRPHSEKGLGSEFIPRKG